MESLKTISKLVHNKRLSMNITMDVLASRAGISRATLSAIESGGESYSVNSLLKVLNVLGISFNVEKEAKAKLSKQRASRTNTKKDKLINDFIILCIEHYAKTHRVAPDILYSRMKERGILDYLKEWYDDLHGYSFDYIDQEIEAML